MRAMLVCACAVAGCSSERAILLLPDEPPVPFDNRAPLASTIQIDRLVQSTVPQSDVLFIVDNSSSMAEEQDLLAANFPSMLEWFLASATDYHVGVVTTDMADPLQAGALRLVDDQRWLDPADPTPEETFARMVTPGINGATREQGRAAAYTALAILGDTTNAGFVRDGASMNLVVLSDENDGSEVDPISLDDWIDYLQAFRPLDRMVSFSSIVSPFVGCPTAGSPGTEYIVVTAAVGGLYSPICTEDWSGVLAELAFISTGQSNEFFLSRLPVVSTLKVSVETDTGTVPFAADEWDYNPSRNSILFDDYVPTLFSVVVVEYEVASSIDITD